MIALLGASAITLAALQAAINAPRDQFRECLKAATQKATSERVGADAIENYLSSACSVQMQSLKTAVIAFRVKNGMAKKAAVEDAQMTVEDYMSSPVDNYKFTFGQQQQATASTQPPKP
jgi:arginine deiminase